MSMILDALTRAEHERQIEKQPDLKFTEHVKPQNNKPNKIWLWVVCGLVINALLIFLLVRAFSTDGSEAKQVSAPQAAEVIPQDANKVASVSNSVKTEVPAPAIVNQPVQARLTPEVVEEVARPLVMEANTPNAEEVDRPLIYEAKQPKPKVVAKAKPTAKTNPAATKGNVSFSSTQLSVDGAAPIIEKPKLLIDQGDDVPVVAQANTSASAPSLRDLPSGTRNSLKQYEVNVHVYDDDPLRRFVLINMDKYKEGDQIANNGPTVETITADGVIVDYGNGKALLPPK